MKSLLMLGVPLLFAVPSAARAQDNPCTKVGQEVCQQGQVYRCEQAGSEIGPIFQNRKCVVSTLMGVWRGTGHQSPAGAAGADYPVVMTLKNDGGSIDYPSLGCGGALTWLSRDTGSGQLRETITYGGNRCANGGLITVRLSGARLSWTWTEVVQGDPMSVIAVLSR